ncbi:hypothetical protein [Bosea sp. ANAM02]|uniref:hypothetical protein n=1 Tax=Bosea sp. ANAM02 TaxID=2020412 RepID=UPI00140EF54E|nr:hypothetical protein [Bosea sp. ANAM02]BCB21902.1 hypothetical protein OCUBac02_47960 [Bosea sp. ANAM02]
MFSQREFIDLMEANPFSVVRPDGDLIAVVSMDAENGLCIVERPKKPELAYSDPALACHALNKAICDPEISMIRRSKAGCEIECRVESNDGECRRRVRFFRMEDGKEYWLVLVDDPDLEDSFEATEYVCEEGHITETRAVSLKVLHEPWLSHLVESGVAAENPAWGLETVYEGRRKLRLLTQELFGKAALASA